MQIWLAAGLPLRYLPTAAAKGLVHTHQMDQTTAFGSNSTGLPLARPGLPQSTGVGPPTVLLVADDPPKLQSVLALLPLLSVAVCSAEAAPGVLAKLPVQEVSLALIDVQSSGEAAAAVAQALRGSARSRHIPIIFLLPTGPSAPEALQAFGGTEAAAIDYLYKPLDALVLASKLKMFGDLHRQRRLLAQQLSEAHQAAQLNALMLAALSHDIRSPLATLVLNAEIVLRRADSPGLRQAGERVKAAAAMMRRQVDHLVNLSQGPTDSLRTDMALGDFGSLASGRVQALVESTPGGAPITLSVDGPIRARFDPALLAQAVDQLLGLSVTHAQGQPVAVTVTGRSQHAVVLQIAIAAVLADPLLLHLFGRGPATKGLPATRLGPGLAAAGRIARAHGGSLIGRSREPDGTLFELMLPRGGQV